MTGMIERKESSVGMAVAWGRRVLLLALTILLNAGLALADSSKLSRDLKG